MFLYLLSKWHLLPLPGVESHFVEDSKGHDSACHQERQSQDVNSLHGLQVYRLPKKITTHTDTGWNSPLLTWRGGRAQWAWGVTVGPLWPAGLARLRREQPVLTPLLQCRAPSLPARRGQWGWPGATWHRTKKYSSNLEQRKILPKRSDQRRLWERLLSF